MYIEFKKLSENAKVPLRGSEGAAGYDLYSVDSVTIVPGERKLIKTDIAVSIPYGFYGRVAPRSGLAFKNGIDVLAGVIDSDYRNGVGVILINLGKDDFVVNVGDRVAQLIIEYCKQVDFTEVSELETSIRGLGGFGSTGV